MEVKNFFRPEGNYFSFHADTLLYTRRFDNRIYRIENGKAMTFMEIDFGKFFNAENRLLSNTEMQRQDPKGNVLSINNIKHSNGKLMFNIFPHGIMTCTTEGVAPAQYDHFTNSNFSIMHSQMNASWDTTGNSLVYSVDNLNLRTDNPVLFIYRMK